MDNFAVKTQLNNTQTLTNPANKSQISYGKKKKKGDFTNAKVLSPEEKLNQIYRSQGLIGKFYDKIQSALNIGMSKKKLQTEIKNGNSDDVNKKLDKYYDNQKNATEVTLDLMTGLQSVGLYKFLKKTQAYSHLYIKNKKFEFASSMIGIVASGISGMITKPILKSINNIGMSKEDKKRERTTWRNLGSGLVDGLTAPLAFAYKLGLLGAVGINSVSRYIFNKKANKDASFSDYLENGWVAKAPMLAIATLSAVKFHKRIDKIENAIIKSKENIKNIQTTSGTIPLSELGDLAKNNLKDKKTQSDLVDVARKGFFSKFYLKATSPIRALFSHKEGASVADVLEFIPKPLKRIAFMDKELIKEKELTNIMKELEQYNIFYPKMIQSMPSNISSLIDLAGDGSKFNKLTKKINKSSSPNKGWFRNKMDKFFASRKEYVEDKGIKTLNDFLNNYKSSCPASRTGKEAQKYISKTFGDRFTIAKEKPLGVGTIAETFLAKDNQTGEDVVIKMIKKWVSVDKLNADKEKMLQSLERVKNQMSQDDYNYQKKLVDELYKAWSKEIDLSLEADAGKKLGEFAENYNTVKPIVVKDNIYVMEKAKGVQLDKFAEYLKENNIEFSEYEKNELLTKYVQVFLEQLLSVPKKGEKIFHADPHAGNIFVDITNKEKPFTFIDTGNVLRYTPEEAIQNVTSHVDYLIGNSKYIAKRLLKGAILPEGMSQKEAEDMLSKHLDEKFFSGKNRILGDPFSTINTESSEFMRNHKVIMNSNNTNFVKAEMTYLINLLSMGNLKTKIKTKVKEGIKLNEEEQQEKTKLALKQIGKSILNGIVNNKKTTIEEVWNRYRYLEENPEQFFTTLYSYIPPQLF